MLSRYPIEGDTVVVFQGPTGQQRYVRIEYADGTKQFYEGSTGAERVVKIEYPDGETVFYEGPRGEESVLRVEQREVQEAAEAPWTAASLPSAQERPRLPSHGVNLLGKANVKASPSSRRSSADLRIDKAQTSSRLSNKGTTSSAAILQY